MNFSVLTSSTANTRRSELPDDPPHVTIVARSVGDSPGSRFGGTNAQVAALVEGYLRLGGEVTLICRESVVPDHPRLTVRRLRVPSRPSLLGSPWFIIAASLAVARHGRGLIHSTGALVVSKVDV